MPFNCNLFTLEAFFHVIKFPTLLMNVSIKTIMLCEIYFKSATGHGNLTRDSFLLSSLALKTLLFQKYGSMKAFQILIPFYKFEIKILFSLLHSFSTRREYTELSSKLYNYYIFHPKWTFSCIAFKFHSLNAH